MNNFRPVRYAVLQEELMALTRNTSQAILLNQFLYWTRRSYEFDEFLELENQRRQQLKLPPVNVQFQDGWFSKSLESLSDETMILSSERSLKGFLLSLVERGWVERRPNAFTFGKDDQYRVNLSNL